MPAKKQTKTTPKPTILRRNAAVERNLLPRRRLVRVLNCSRVAPFLGRAVAANEPINAGEVACTYAGKVLHQDEVETLLDQHSNPFCPEVAYFLLLEDDANWVIDGNPKYHNLRDSPGSFINDARGINGARENCDFRIDWDKKNGTVLIVVVATRDIDCNEELWASYGKHWWDFTARNPDSPCSCQSASKTDFSAAKSP